MARATPNQMGPSTPIREEKSPVIEYFGDEAKAKLVEFTINPKAVKYVVHDTGMIVETLG